jgi:hypothetical protein
LNGKAKWAACGRTSTVTLEDVERAGVLREFMLPGGSSSDGFFSPFRSISKTVQAGSPRSQLR